MSKQQAHIVMESIDIRDSEDYSEALLTLAQAELEGDTEDEWDDIFPF